jgi:ubiquinone/menaquinone biosynthesis C-methylase UbiE
MPLARVLEPEVMDTAAEAIDYDTMDHAAVNRAFVDDLLATGAFHSEGVDVLDLGAGTAQIPIELCTRTPNCRVMAVDLSIQMLQLAVYNVEARSLTERIQLAHVDAKQLPFGDGQFHVVMSNSIVHHIPQPLDALAAAVRVTAPGGRLFFRDLLRPADDAAVAQLVQTYAGDQNPHQRQMFDDSLRAALTLAEIRDLVAQLGFSPDTVAATSDRHWTWSALRPASS